MHQRGGHDILARQRLVERALADDLGGFVAKRIIAIFLERLAQVLEDLAERTLAGAVADETVLVLQFDVETVHIHRRQPGCPVPAETGGIQYFLGHAVPARYRKTGQRIGQAVGFTEGSLKPGKGSKSAGIRAVLARFSLTRASQRL